MLYMHNDIFLIDIIGYDGVELSCSELGNQLIYAAVHQ